MVYFKKRYCRYCGNVLQRKRTERIVREGDADHEEYCSIGRSYHFYGDILVIGKEYYCPHCDKHFSCEEQAKVIEAQIQCIRKIVSPEEIEIARQNAVVKAKQNIYKSRWLLLIPFIGGIICILLATAGDRGYLDTAQANKTFYVPFLVTFLVMLVAKLVFQIDESRVLYIIGALTFNIPVLCLIVAYFQ